MRWTPLVVVGLAIMGCSDGEPIDTSGPDVPPFDYDLSAQAKAGSARVELPQAAVDAHAAVTTFMSINLLAVAEPHVQNVLGHPASPENNCWETINQQFTTFDVSYKNCKDLMNTQGTIRVRQVLAGYKAFQFLGMSMEGRAISGALGLDGTGAPPLTFATYDTQAEEPSPEKRSPISVNIGGTTYSIDWTGGLVYDPEAKRLRSWGVGEVGGLSTLTTVRVGGLNADELVGLEPPPDALVGNTNYDECRCPDSGRMAYELPIDIVRLEIDLDDLQPVDDGFDDPVLEMDVHATVQGEFIVDTTKCGEYDLEVRLDQNTVTVPVSGLIVGAAIQKQCDALLINDKEKCEALVGIASRTDNFEFLVDANVVTEGANTDAMARFGGGWCRI